MEELLADPVRLHQALRDAGDRVHVFVDQTGIGVPRAARALYAMLESSVHGVRAPGRGAFHAKVWVARFTAIDDRRQDQPPLLRAAVLSRNLTFDRSWDIALASEASPRGESREAATGPLGDFLAALPRLTGEPLEARVAARVQALAEDTGRTLFPAPAGFVGPIEFHALGLSSPRSWRPTTRGYRTLAIAPFVNLTGLKAIVDLGGSERVLVSRGEELDRLPEDALAGWSEVLVLSDAAQDEPEDGPAGECEPMSRNGGVPSGLHAKIVAVEHGWDVTWYVGSANLTAVAFGGSNVEMMASVTGRKGWRGGVSGHGIDRFLDGNTGFRKLCVPYRRGEVEPEAAEAVSARRRLEEARDHLAQTDVIYLCSNSSIARANLPKLQIGDADQRSFALATRLTMLATQLASPDGQSGLAGNKLNFVSLTPGTSFNMGHSAGQARERQVAFHLLLPCFRSRRTALMNLLQGLLRMWRDGGSLPIPNPEVFSAYIDDLLAIEPDSLGRRPPNLAELLTDVALGSPAIVAARCLRSLGGLDAGLRRRLAVRIADAFWSLFNQPAVICLIRQATTGGADEGDEAAYWRRVLRYCRQGNLQAVLDEHWHLLWEQCSWSEGETAGDIAELCARELIQAVQPVRSRVHARFFRLRNGSLRVPEPEEIRFRTAFALRFGHARNEETGYVSQDAVRRAFNSPFRPFVLASTSIGQEGLDFHPWCHRLAHWNLPGNPVDLEQREGRVHRYKGHAVRRNIAAAYAGAAMRLWRPGDDIWELIFERAERAARAKGESDLVPLWIAPGRHRVQRHVPMLPYTSEVDAFARLKLQLAAYRVVFGQPRQEELLTLLGHSNFDAAQLRSWTIDLSPPANRT